MYKHSGHTYTPNAGIRQDLQYTYDLEGTITTTNDAAPANTYAQGPGNLLRKFNHDPLRRLISATGREISNVYQQPSWDLNIRPMDYTDTNTYTRSYQYDKLGNIQYLSHKAAGHANQNFDRDFTYNSSDNQLKAFTVNSNLFQNKYDGNGNLVQEGQSRFYEWTANDKMAVFKNQAGGSTPSVYTNYFYNARGERIKKHTQKGNKLIVTFYMDGGMFETSYVKPTGGSIDSKRFYNTLHILDQSNNGNNRVATIRVGKNVDDHTPAIKYIVGDHLNNSTAVLKITGTLINREEFYPFGETSFGGFQYKRYRYNGKEKDEESGLYEYGQRYYAPWVCRFVSVDPMAEKFPFYTAYNYAGNKPVSKVDLEGLQEEDAERQGGQTDSGGMRALDFKYGRDTTAVIQNIPVHGNGIQLRDSLVKLNETNGDPKKQNSKSGDNWSIDKNGNVSLESSGSGSNITVNKQKFSEYDFSSNPEAAAKIITHYYDENFSENKYHLANESVSIVAWRFEDLRYSQDDYNVNQDLSKLDSPGLAFAYPASANSDHLNRIYFHMMDGKFPSFQNKYDIISTLSHERTHLIQNAQETESVVELEAYNVQTSHSSWFKTSEDYKLQIGINIKSELIKLGNVVHSSDYSSERRTTSANYLKHYSILLRKFISR